MLGYAPGDSLGHRLDPRTKLLFQAGFAAAGFAHATPRGLAVLTAVAGVALACCRLSPVAALGEVRLALPLLVAGPLVETVRLGAPWVAPAAALPPALASYRTLLLLALAVAYVRTTPVRESEAAVAWLVPGRAGRALGVGVGLVFRFLPALQADLRRARDASRARLGGERPVRERVRVVAAAGLRRAFGRADRLTLALRARCLAWNPTPPPLAPSRADAAVAGAALALVAWAAVPALA